MSESLRDLLQRGADTVQRPRLDVSDLVALTERRLVRRRLATSRPAPPLSSCRGRGLRAPARRRAPGTCPTGARRNRAAARLYYDAGEFVLRRGERYVVVPPGVYAVPFSGWGDLPPEVADLRAVVTFPAGFMSLPPQHVC